MRPDAGRDAFRERSQYPHVPSASDVPSRRAAYAAPAAASQASPPSTGIGSGGSPVSRSLVTKPEDGPVPGAATDRRSRAQSRAASSPSSARSCEPGRFKSDRHGFDAAPDIPLDVIVEEAEQRVADPRCGRLCPTDAPIGVVPSSEAAFRHPEDAKPC